MNDIKARIQKILSQSTVVEDNYKCKKCNDRGYIFEPNQYGGDIAIPCECKEVTEAMEKLNKCGLTEAFKKKTFKNYETTTNYQVQAKMKAMKYCNDFINTNASLLLCGQPGAGKTHLGIATMLQLIEKNVGVKYEEYTSMMMNLKQSVMDEENFIREESKYTSPRVLFLDDFLKGNPTPADLKYIYKIINQRYLQGKPIIISTEKTPKEIIQWDEAVGSRIIEMTQGNIITFERGSLNYRIKDFM